MCHFQNIISCCMALLCAIAAVAAAPEPAKPPVVYIAGFSDASGGRAWENVELAVRDLLVSAVSTENCVRIVDRDRLDVLLREQQLTLMGLTDSASSARVGRLLGADRMVTGRLLIENENLTIIAHIVDVPTAVIQSTCQAKGRISDLLEVVLALARDMAQALEIPFDPGVIREIDVRPVCSLNFLRGVGFYHTGDYDRALMDFMISGDLDPDNFERHYWMARCHLALGEQEHARVELWRFLRAVPDKSQLRDAVQLLNDLNCAPSTNRLY